MAEIKHITAQNLDLNKITTNKYSAAAGTDYVNINDAYFDGDLTAEKMDNNTYLISKDGTALGYTSVIENVDVTPKEEPASAQTQGMPASAEEIKAPTEETKVEEVKAEETKATDSAKIKTEEPPSDKLNDTDFDYSRITKDGYTPKAITKASNMTIVGATEKGGGSRLYIYDANGKIKSIAYVDNLNEIYDVSYDDKNDKIKVTYTNGETYIPAIASVQNLNMSISAANAGAKNESLNAYAELSDKNLDVDAIKADFSSDMSPEEIAALKAQGILYGIDVSDDKGVIDWAAVKRSGISFVNIKCGARGYKNGGLIDQKRFIENVKGAVDAGLEVGLYYYGAAINEDEAREEANTTLAKIDEVRNTLGDKYADAITLPISYDYEAFGTCDDKVTPQRCAGLSKEEATKNVEVYNEILNNAGYNTSTYSYTAAFNNYIDESKLHTDKNDIWLAKYDNNGYNNPHKMLQYTSKGSVEGISGNVDLDIMYTK